MAKKSKTKAKEVKERLAEVVEAEEKASQSAAGRLDKCEQEDELAIAEFAKRWKGAQKPWKLLAAKLVDEDGVERFTTGQLKSKYNSMIRRVVKVRRKRRTVTFCGLREPCARVCVCVGGGVRRCLAGVACWGVATGAQHYPTRQGTPPPFFFCFCFVFR
jgi:hypothetical protein